MTEAAAAAATTNSGDDKGGAAAAGGADAGAAAAAAAAAAGSGAAAAGSTGGDGKPAAGGTILDQKGEGQAADPKAGDWRAKFAGEDPAALKRLSRYADEKAFFDGFRNLEKKLGTEGAAKTVALGENPTAEEVKAYREANGIPETPDKYEVAAPEGYVWGEADKPLLDSFKAHAHGKNWSPAQLNEAVSWYTAQQGEMAKAVADKDAAFHTQATAELAQEWGPEFKANVNAVANLLETFPEGVAARLQGGRTADGKKIGDDPGVMRALAQIARELNPAATLLPAGQSNVAGVSTRIAAIEKTMKEDNRAYWSDGAMQKEYGELLAAREKLQARA